MSTSRVLSCCLIVALSSVLGVAAQRGVGAPVWFEGARLIVGDGSAPVENSAFVVEGDAFTWVGRKGERQPPPGAVRVDLSGKTVMPALIDGHNHIGLVNEKDGSNSKANYRRANLVDQLERYAYYGVAAALSMGLEADEELAYQLRDEVIPNAARFLTVGKGIAATPIGGPTGEPRLGIPYGARTEKEGRAHVKALRARGVRFVKIWVDDRNGDAPKIQPNVYRAIIAEAHANGMEVLAHLSRTSALADAKDLLRAGVDGFVHLVRDRDVDDEYLAAVKARPLVWSGPNIPVPSTRDSVASLAETLPAAQIETMRAQLTQREANGNPPDELFELHCRNLRKIHAAGMVIGMGTDGTGDGFGAHEQIEAYTRCGMTTMEALVAGTGTNARLLRLDRLGTIAARKEASFNVLNANPLDSIMNTRRISAVYLRGQELGRQALRARFAAGPGQGGAAAAAARPLALVGGTLIDGSGAAPVRDSVVLVRGDRIERVGTVASLPVPVGYERISTEGMTVLPGLWDLHVHLIYSGHPNPGAWFAHAAEFERVTIPASARQMLMAGVTSVRDLAAPSDAILGVKKRIAAGELPGPTLYAAGPALAKLAPGQTTVTSQFLPIAGEADARAKVRQLAEAGVDLIKIFFVDRMTPEERSALVSEAHARGKKVAMHGSTDAEIRLGLAIGIDSPEFAPDIMASLRERVKAGPPLYWTPTVGANGLLNADYFATKPEILDDPEAFLGLPPNLVDEVKRGWQAYQARPSRPGSEAIVRRKIAQMQEVGVRILFGSDEGSAGEPARHATWMDADLWVRVLGMDPMVVLRSMTADAARAMGVDGDVGTVAAGKRADVIAVAGDPLRDIGVLREPKVVVARGRRYR